MSFNSRDFRNAMGAFATGVTVISVADDEDVHGMTANSITSVSLNPPIVLACVDQKAKCLNLIENAGYFGVNILKDYQVEISKLFANQKIEQTPTFTFRQSEIGAPLLNDALVSLNCKVIQSVVSGDHTVFFGEVVELNVDEGTPLCFFKGQYRALAEK